jgi:phosphocarrier protein
MQKKQITIINKLGLHARAAAKFVATASRFASKIEVNREGRKVNGKSIMGVMMLAASKGTVLEIMADGDDELEALRQIELLISNRFGEES